jgi:CheY-like chemotaxis protein
VPSLILMDVQMPILDGYHATHLLRHHHPYASIEAIKRIPIIAMTASAIRGDRERCERSGMDDYLAKPVKRSVLEKMILKWVTKQNTIRRGSISKDGEMSGLTRSSTDHSSNCPDHDAIAIEFLNARAAAMAVLTEESQISIPDHADTPPHVTSRPRRSSRSTKLMAQGVPTAENEADRALRREEAEDKARSLRDAKLFSAIEDEHGMLPANPSNHETAGNLTLTGNSMPVAYPSAGDSEYEGGVMALTEANVERFNNGVDGHGPSNTTAAVNVLGVSPADIPGPPPGLLQQPTFTPQILAEPTPLAAANAVQEVGPVTVPTSLKQHRADLGALKTADRSRSDWTTSTAKPDGRPDLGRRSRSSSDRKDRS